MISSVSIIFIDLGETSVTQFKWIRRGLISQYDQDAMIAFALATFLIFYTLFVGSFLQYSTKEYLKTKETRQKVGNFYPGVRLNEIMPLTEYFLPVFLVNRLIFVAIPLVFVNNGPNKNLAEL